MISHTSGNRAGNALNSFHELDSKSIAKKIILLADNEANYVPSSGVEENKSQIMTYEEYLKYCEEYSKSQEIEKELNSSKAKQVIKAYSDVKREISGFSVDSEA